MPKDQRDSPGRIFTFETLPEKGIDYSRNHVRRLIKDGQVSQAVLSERARASLDRAHPRPVDQRAAKPSRRVVQTTSCKVHGESGTSGCTRAACRRKTKRWSPVTDETRAEFATRCRTSELRSLHGHDGLDKRRARDPLGGGAGSK